METIDYVEKTQKTPIKETLKKHSLAITTGVLSLALAGWTAYDNHKRNNRKEERYYDHLDQKIELQRDALGAYKDSLDNDRPTNIEPKDQ